MRYDVVRIGRACWIVAAVAFSVFFAASMPASAQAPPPVDKAPDLTKVPTLYEVGYTHLDTEWCWMYPQVINEFIPNTLHQNFALLNKYPDYVFNWTGANRYKFMKEYYPADYQTLKGWVKSGRWVTGGSSVEEGDVDIPSEESIIRQVMYGNEYFKDEFGSYATDFMLPDCFGFPGDLPSIMHHCGILGFSTQKLTWGSAVGIPFNLGKWIGTDNTSIYAALNGGDYNAPFNGDVSKSPTWLARIDKEGAASGIYADFNYYGVGDRGGSVRDQDAKDLETTLHSGGPVSVVSAREDQVFNDLQSYDTSKLPTYKGDLLLTWHSSGSSTSQAEQKRWNHENEKLADATERASVAADWLGALPYDKARITDAWWKFLPGQFHDLMAGTALPMAYEYSWNDEVLALNEFAGQLQEAVGGVSRALDTSGVGLPVVVYNQLSTRRQDDVEASVTFPGTAPGNVKVLSPTGIVVPSQVESRSAHTVKVLFLATTPSVGYSTYHVVPSSATMLTSGSGLSVTTHSLENARFRVAINAAGDVSSIYDKKAGKEMLSAPLRLSFQYENPSQFPAWNMDYSDQTAPAEGYVDGPAKISISEDGPVRVAVSVDRTARGSHFITTYQLSAGEAGDRLEVNNSIDWRSRSCALMVVFPLTVANQMATYNWELGTIQRSTDDPAKYEVPAHQWFDLTDNSGSYGVSILSGDRYGSDKPDSSTLRLTLIYTPGVRAGYTHQATNDIGHHELSFAITGHSGSWQSGGTQWESIRFDRPLVAFQAPSHPGLLGPNFSFVHTNNANVSVEALKQAEKSHEIVVRFNELAGVPQSNVVATFASPVVSAREVNGQEAPLGSATVRNGALVFDMAAYRPRAFAVTLAPAPVHLTAPTSVPVTLAYNDNVTKPFGSATGGSFDSQGNAIPADMLPSSVVCDGIKFLLANASAAENAVQAQGQTMSVPNLGPGSRFYFLAASSDGDVPETFTVGDKPVSKTIEAWNGKIGQWDDRQWGGVIPTLTYDMTNPFIGLKPGYIKRDAVAWYSDHLRAGDGTNEPYQYCYLYRYALDLPAGAKKVTLPNDSRIKILAATVSNDPNAATVPAGYLYDTLQHPISNAPSIDIEAASTGQGVTVNALPPLYFHPNASVRYTLNGSAPTAASPAFGASFSLTESATIKAAYVDDNGSVEGVATSRYTAMNPVGPTVTSIATASPTALTLTFSEPVSPATAQDVTHYTVSPADTVTDATVLSSGNVVALSLANPVAATPQATISVDGVTSALPNGMAVSGALGMPIPAAHVVYQQPETMSFDGTSSGYSKNVESLPVGGKDPWSINLFARFDNTPGELTTLAGFGDDTDTSGSERYILKFHDGIHFWASNTDITSGVPYDLGKWQMVTATFDGTTLTLYKNGQMIKTAPLSLNDATPVVKIGPVGPWPQASKLNGKIAGLTIWNSALGQDQIAALLSGEPAN